MTKNNLRLIVLFITLACLHQIAKAQPNTLTAKEKEDGWQLLFNGKDLHGWHSYMQKKPGKAWQIQNGMIALNKNPKSVYQDYGDLVTDDEFDNFDFKLEWKMEPCSTSGVMIYVNAW